MLISEIPFEKWATLKILHDDGNNDDDENDEDNDDNLPSTIAGLFLRNRQAKTT